jgi:transcriptional pleiotropic regulator of transition state genes
LYNFSESVILDDGDKINDKLKGKNMEILQIKRLVQKQGRVTIPKEICEKMGIKSDIALVFTMLDDKIIVTKEKESCVFCNDTENLRKYKEILICPTCINNIKNDI